MSIKSILFAALVLLATKAFSQGLSTLPGIMEQIIRGNQDTAKIYYIDSLISFSHLKPGTFNKKKFQHTAIMYRSLKGNSIRLTSAERKHVISEFKKMQSQVWQKNLFNNSQRIPYDSVGVYLASFERKNHPYHPANGYQYWRFSRPVYLRGDTICLIAFVYMCGSLCGEDEFALYKKNEDGRWERFVLISGGVF
jgi:hypothetical protein